VVEILAKEHGHEVLIAIGVQSPLTVDHLQECAHLLILDARDERNRVDARLGEHAGKAHLVCRLDQNGQIVPLYATW